MSTKKPVADQKKPTAVAKKPVTEVKKPSTTTTNPSTADKKKVLPTETKTQNNQKKPAIVAKKPTDKTKGTETQNKKDVSKNKKDVPKNKKDLSKNKKEQPGKKNTGKVLPKKVPAVGKKTMVASKTTAVVGKKPVDVVIDSLKYIQKCVMELRKSNNDLNQHLKDLPVIKCREISYKDKNIIVLFSKARKMRELKPFMRQIIEELEKMTGKHVVIIGNRKIIKKPERRSPLSKIHRPFNKTLTGVHEAMLNDLVFPSEVMGKRITYNSDGSLLRKVFVDLKMQFLSNKLGVFNAVYKNLTSKDIKFEFPLYDDLMRL